MVADFSVATKNFTWQLSAALNSVGVLEAIRPCPCPRGVSRITWHVLGIEG